MIQCAEGRMRTIFDSNDDYINDENPLFFRINGSPRFGIALHLTPTKNRINNSDEIDTQKLFQGK